MRTVSVVLQLVTNAYTAGAKAATQATDAIGKSLDKVADKKQHIDTVSGALGVIGLTAGAVAGLAIKKYSEFSSAMSKVRAATHETAGNMSLLREAALKAGADTAFSATEAAGAIEQLSKAGVQTRDILGGGLAGSLSLAAAGELEVADAAETAATALVQFKLKGSDIPHVADLLAAGAGKAQGSVADLSMALKQGGLVASQAGLSIEETTGTLAAFAAAGLLGSDAGTSMKTMLLQLMNPSKEAAGLMQELGITAYAANGSFVGMSDLAEQLKVRLGGLSEEQRNAALATIFGSDAIRAASVLYSNGGAGIQDWTNKVNDAGYAAETAALMTDNLQGDVERLGGSFDTALIRLGEGADGLSRTVVQSLTGIVDWMGRLPAAGQNAILMGTLVIGGASLVAAGGLKAVTVIADVRAAMTALGWTAKGTALALGAIGIALAAVVGGVIYFGQKQAEAAQNAEALKATLDQQTGAITGNSRAWAVKALREAGALDQAESMGVSLRDLTDAYLGNDAAIARVNGQLKAYVGTAGEYSIGAEEAGSQTDDFQRRADKLLGTIGGGNKTLADARHEMEQNAEAGAEGADAYGQLTGSVEMSTAAMEDNENAVSDAANQLGDMEDRAQELKDTLELLNGTLTEREAQSGYEQAIDDVNTRLKEYKDLVSKGDDATKGMKNALDNTSQAGRDNEKVLTDLWKKAGDYATEALRVEGNQAKANKILREGRADLVEMATKFLGSKKAAEEYVTEVLGIPPNVTTNVSAPGLKPARDTAEDYKIIMGAIKPNKQTNWKAPGLAAALTNTKALAKAAQSAAGSYYLTYYVTTVQRNKMENAHGFSPRVGQAGGGWVQGPGGPRDDMVPRWLSNGEYVVNAADASRNAGLLEAINSGITVGEPGIDLAALKARGAIGRDMPTLTIKGAAAPAPYFTASNSGAADLAAALRAARIGGGGTININPTTTISDIPALAREVARILQFEGVLG